MRVVRRTLQLLRFDQPVARVDVGSKSALDAVLLFDPVDWATDYTGVWLSSILLLVTVTAVPTPAHVDPVRQAAVAVGSLRATVRPSGGITSEDGTSMPSNASTVVTTGSWGDVVCDGGLFVYSHTAVVAAFLPPVAALHPPANYTLTLSSHAGLPAGSPTRTIVVSPAQSAADSDIVLPSALPAASLRFVVPSLPPGEPVSVQVTASMSPLPVDVTRVLPRPVAPLAWPLGSRGGCSCAGMTAGSVCSTSASEGQIVTPSRPAIGMSSPCRSSPAV